MPRSKKKQKKRDEKRQGLIGVSKANSVEEVLAACTGSCGSMPADAVTVRATIAAACVVRYFSLEVPA